MGIWRVHPWKTNMTLQEPHFSIIDTSSSNGGFSIVMLVLGSVPLNATPSALRFLPDCFDAFRKKCLNKMGSFFSCDAKIPLVGNITNLPPQRQLWWNAILPSLLESPFRKIFTFFCDDFFKKNTFSNRNTLGKLLSLQIPKLLSFKKAFVFSRGKVPPTILGGCSQLRVFQPKTSKAEPETLRADMLLDERRNRFVAAVVFCGEKSWMVKWPFKGANWPPTGESKGHFASPGWDCCLWATPFFLFFFGKEGLNWNYRELVYFPYVDMFVHIFLQI